MTSNIQKVYSDTPEDISKRKQLVSLLSEEDGIHDTKVLAAMQSVPRHWFVPAMYQARAYENIPLPIGHGQTISQPFIVAYAAQVLRLTGKESVLEIGGGGGYQVAVLGVLADSVVAVEQQEELVDSAREVISQMGLRNVRLVLGDGKQGWLEGAPYDRILVSCAARDVPPAWERQLRPGGVLVFPHEQADGQWMERWVRGEEGWTHREKLLAVKFVPLL